MFHYLTEPHHFEYEHVKDFQSRHLASEPHIRIHTSDIPYRKEEKYFEYHGEVLIIILEGSAILKTNFKKIELKVNDQILLTNGNPFFLTAKEENENCKVEFIWTPGPNPCKVCWETGNRFYKANT